MKTLISAVILSTLSFGAAAVNCDSIGKGIVDQYAAAAGFSNDTPAQKSAYLELVAAHVQTCRTGVEARKNGLSVDEVNQVVSSAYRGRTKQENINPVISKAMTVTSYTQGYAFGE